MNSIDQELINAAWEKNMPEVERLLSVGTDVNAKDSDGGTPLHSACCTCYNNGDLQVFQALLEHGANIEAKTNQGCTPLHLACCRESHLAVVKALLSGGANVLAVNDHRLLPIHYAVRLGYYAVSKYLLQEIYATSRRLPLHELVQDLTWIGNAYVARIGVPPLRTAIVRNVVRTDDVVEIIEYLVGRSPTWICSRDQDGSLPLHVACRRGASFSIVQCLVNCYKASVKKVTPQGDVSLFLACEMPEPSLDTIFLLIKLYPDLVYR
jgi:ankyrin repeat protein